jgi:hypothetical protein
MRAQPLPGPPPAGALIAILSPQAITQQERQKKIKVIYNTYRLPLAAFYGPSQLKPASKLISSDYTSVAYSVPFLECGVL